MSSYALSNSEITVTKFHIFSEILAIIFNYAMCKVAVCLHTSDLFMNVSD